MICPTECGGNVMDIPWIYHGRPRGVHGASMVVHEISRGTSMVHGWHVMGVDMACSWRVPSDVPWDMP